MHVYQLAKVVAHLAIISILYKIILQINPTKRTFQEHRWNRLYLYETQYRFLSEALPGAHGNAISVSENRRV